VESGKARRCTITNSFPSHNQCISACLDAWDACVDSGGMSGKDCVRQNAACDNACL
jgi:hypothetical protein